MTERHDLDMPELTEQGKIEAQAIMDSFKPKIKALIDEVMGDLYVDVSSYIESDHWTNYRNSILSGLSGYNGHEYENKRIRDAIYHNNKEQIDKDLNQDLLKEIENLKVEMDYIRMVRL